MRAVLLLSLAFLVAGCDSTAPDASGVGDLTVRLLPPEDAGAYRLLVQTEEVYGAVCWEGVEADVGARKAHVDVVSDETAEVCGAVVGPLTTVVVLPVSVSEGYEVELRKDGKTDRYRLVRFGDELPLGLSGAGSFSRVLAP